ncbi:hypothetical protein WA026_013123 [Henosepilachna vigintioctopunctata]|uniref:Uncharacterized protein n=1 Tax=Henosepilachna vigintioctopunctata TaxID=420089 RepID=A0AAW1UJC2_9CUCU
MGAIKSELSSLALIERQVTNQLRARSGSPGHPVSQCGEATLSGSAHMVLSAVYVVKQMPPYGIKYWNVMLRFTVYL